MTPAGRANDGPFLVAHESRDRATIRRISPNGPDGPVPSNGRAADAAMRRCHVMRLMFPVVVAGALLTACSPASAPQQGTADKAAAPAAAPATPQPATAPPSASPEAAPPAAQPQAPAPAAAAPAATPEAPPPAAAGATTSGTSGKPAATSAAPKPAAAAPAAATAADPAPAPRTPAPPPPPPEPKFRELTIPADMTMTITLATPINSDTSKPEDTVGGTLAKSIVISGETAVPAGSKLVGSVLEANGAGRVKGRASVAFQFDRIQVRGERLTIHTERIVREAGADTKGDVKKGGIGAGAGAVIGGIAGGGKGAAIGSVVGGTGAVLATKGKEVRLVNGDVVTTTLRQPLTVLVPIDRK